MWAAQLPRTPWSLNIISAFNPPPRCEFSTAVHNHQSRKEIGGLGVSVFAAALKSNKPFDQNPVKPLPPPPKEEESEFLQQEKQMSGADVLIALQKATVQKLKKQKWKKDVYRARKNGGKVNQEIPNFNNVHPLSIKPEWSERLEEFERKLEEIIHS